MPHQLARTQRYRHVHRNTLRSLAPAGARFASRILKSISKKSWKGSSRKPVRGTTRRFVPRNAGNPNAIGSRGKQGTGRESARKVVHRTKRQKCMSTFDVSTTGQSLIGSTAGFQGVGNILTLANRNDFITGNITNGVAPYFDMNPNEKLTGSGATVIYPTGQIPTNDRILLQGVDLDFSLTNFENIESSVTIYIYMWKQNCNLQLIDLWAQAMIAMQNGTNNVTNPGPGNVGVPAAGNPDVGQWGEKPFSFRDVRKQVRLLKAFHYDMASGSTQNFKYSVKLDRVCDKEYFNTVVDTKDQYVKGVSVGVMSVCRGQVVMDKTGTKTPTLGNAEIGMVWRAHTRLGLLKSMASRIDTNRHYTIIPTNTTLLNQHAINENDVDTVVIQE